jgi:ABC-2 type transport system permease protein
MSTAAAIALTDRPPVSPLRHTSRLYAREARYEILKALRLPAYLIPTLTFPLVFYVFFGVLFGRQSVGVTTMSTYLIATYGSFGVIGATLFGFGVGVAVERGQGWMLVKRATPMPPAAYFFAKTVMALLFAAAVVAGLSLLGFTLGHVRMAPATWLGLAATLIAGAIPFCAMGLLLGYVAGPNSAPGVVNLIYLPMSLCSGLWIPVRMLPGVMKSFAVWLPPYHYSQLALKWIGADQGGRPLVHVAYLVVFTALCLAGARVAYRRDEGKTYG